MHYYTTPAFEQTLQGLPDARKMRVKKAIQLAVAFFETGQLPHGLGFKPLRHQFWEIRAGINDRIVFRKAKDVIEFIFVGSHDEIKRFLKRI